MRDEPPPVPSLAESIIAADEGRQTSVTPLPKGWASLVERDRRSRAQGHPNAAGGYLNLLYPWRLYIAIGGSVFVLVLLVVSAVSK